MLRSVEKLQGFAVRAVDGDAGVVHDLYFDDAQWIVRYLVVTTGSWLTGRQRVLISPYAVELPHWEEQVLPIALTRAQVERSPDIDLDKPVSRQQLIELDEYYGWPGMWGGSTMMGTATVNVYPMVLAGAEQTEEALEEGDLTERYRGDPHLRSARHVTGYHARTLQGEEVGRVGDFLVDEVEWALRYLRVDTGTWLSPHRVLVPPRRVARVHWPTVSVYLDLPARCIEDGPPYDPAVPVSQQYEAELQRYYEDCRGGA